MTIKRQGGGEKIARVMLDGAPVDGWLIKHAELENAGELVIEVEPSRN